MDSEEFTFESLGPGIYVDHDHPQIIFLNAGELLHDRAIPDNQENRASIYAALLAVCKGFNGELVLITDEGVPSLQEAIRDLST